MSDAGRARERARRLYRSPAFRTAYVNGARAASAGKTVDACPYSRDPGKTWRYAYRKAWLRGHASVPQRFA